MADQRVFTRVPFVESLTWEDMTGNQGAAEVQNVGRGGIGLISSSYLRPGPMVNLLFESVEFDDRPIELQALVSWCNPHGRQSNSFLVGLSWVHGEQRTLPTVNEVFYSAIHQQAVSNHIVGN